MRVEAGIMAGITDTPLFAVRSATDPSMRVWPHSIPFRHESTNAWRSLSHKPYFAKLLHFGINPFRRWRGQYPDTCWLDRSLSVSCRELTLCVAEAEIPGFDFRPDLWNLLDAHG